MTADMLAVVVPRESGGNHTTIVPRRDKTCLQGF